MLTRIISGAVMIAVCVGVLLLGAQIPLVLAIFLAVICAIAVFEVLYNTGAVKNKWVVLIASLYSAGNLFAYCGYTQKVFGFLTEQTITLGFAVLVVLLAVVLHKQFSLYSIAALISMPLILSFAFASLRFLYLGQNGLFYLLLLLNFSSICDCGAYFVGVTMGKHKLCPEISPKKTIEGAVGGIISSLLVSVLLCFTMNGGKNLVTLLILTIPLCILGMFGDLFASVIKRNVGIKDYGKLIPGHGGILDRFDSILLVAPVLLFFVSRGLI